jgi:hypothetical protein
MDRQLAKAIVRKTRKLTQYRVLPAGATYFVSSYRYHLEIAQSFMWALYIRKAREFEQARNIAKFLDENPDSIAWRAIAIVYSWILNIS